ncbi:hypothetical protein [Streptomyces sp. NPDC088141]|uniref:hypothetical protein n=1 Tax=unclassified Streptomyces TaxID=2593676 RepID=UPI003442A03F
MNSRPARVEHFDSAAVFAGMPGTENHGFWRSGPATPPGVPAPYTDQRRSHGDSLILETFSLLGLVESAVPVSELTHAAAPVMAA